MNKTIIAIDPGASGGIAYLTRDSAKVVSMKMPDTEGDILDVVSNLSDPGERVAYVEQVGGFIRGKGAPGSRMFNFGRGFGFLLGCLQSLGWRVELVRPQAWQKPLGIGTKAASGDQWKNKLKAKAQQLYPDQKVTLSTADALLILEYGRRKG